MKKIIIKTLIISGYIIAIVVIFMGGVITGDNATANNFTTAQKIKDSVTASYENNLLTERNYTKEAEGICAAAITDAVKKDYNDYYNKQGEVNVLMGEENRLENPFTINNQ